MMREQSIATYEINHADEAGGQYPAGSAIIVDENRPIGHGSVVLANLSGLLIIRKYSQISGVHTLEPFDEQSMTIEIPDLTCLLGVVVCCCEEE